MQRQIHPDAIELLDKLLEKNALAQDCIVKNQARQLFVETSKACLGIKEVSKNKNVAGWSKTGVATIEIPEMVPPLSTRDFG